MPASPISTTTNTSSMAPSKIPIPTPIPLTLIVATTPSMGIGHQGALPWPPLKAEMAYFARVTKRAPSPHHINAVIMGRRTWESIPARFRPLAGRVNVVLSRSGRLGGLGEEGGLGEGGEDGRSKSGQGPSGGRAGEAKGPIVVGSIAQAVEVLGRGKLGDPQERNACEGKALGRIFVIGGAEVYARALEEPNALRVLLTRVKKDFECDVFFPLSLKEGEEARKGAGLSLEGIDRSRWVKGTKQALDEWTGEDVPSGIQSEKGIEWEFEMWEKQPESASAG